jgi:hypothetical protein
LLPTLHQLQSSVADPHRSDADPDSSCHFDTDPDLPCHFDADPDPICHFDAVRIRIKVKAGSVSALK